jgi:thiamine biosynthesis lipoprotein
MKHLVLTLLLALLSAQAAVPSASGRETMRLEVHVDAMGSAFFMVLYGDDRERLRDAADQAAEEARRLDRMISNYIPSSEWSRINARAAHEAVHVSDEDFNLLAACVQYSRLSEGAFDITVGPLMKVWGFYKGTGHLPHRAEIRGALDRVGYKNILLDPKNHTVRLAREGVEIDPGGIGKGYAVDRIVSILKRDGITSAYIAASRSSIYALGAPPGQPGWKVSIRNPRDADKTVADIVLKDQSMSTSGNYEKFFYADGKIYSHIMDPRTGYPAQGTLSVSVIAPRTIDTEAWTKPLFVNGRRWAAQHKPKGFRVFFCEDKPESNPCGWLQ